MKEFKPVDMYVTPENVDIYIGKLLYNLIEIVEESDSETEIIKTKNYTISIVDSLKEFKIINDEKHKSLLGIIKGITEDR